MLKNYFFALSFWFLVVTLWWRHVYSLFGLVTCVWAPTQLTILLAQDFWNLRYIIRVRRALDWLASISGAKIILKKTKIGYKFYSNKRWIWVYYTHNSQANCGTKLFKPSKEREGLAVCNKINYFSVGCRVFPWCLHDGRMFMHILFTFGWRHHPLRADIPSRFRGSKFHWILGYNTVEFA